METTTWGSTSLHLSTTATYLMLMHCKSTSCFCEQDALSQHSAAGWFVHASCSHHAQRCTCCRKTSAGASAYSHIHDFALAALEISKANLIYHPAARWCAVSPRSR